MIFCIRLDEGIPLFIRNSKDRRFRGASPACPTPVTGRSASFRLRFRFVRAVRGVRAGEAKLRGSAWVDRCPYRWASWELGST